MIDHPNSADSCELLQIADKASPQAEQFRIFRFRTIDSTSEYARTNSDALDDWDLILAEEQTKGRGRHGRKWFSPPEDNIYISLILKTLAPRERLKNLSQVASISIADTISELGLRPAIKWPNDILLSNKKISGILCETFSSPQKKDCAVLGIGMNVNMSESSLSALEIPATSLSIALGKPIDKNSVLKLLIPKLRRDLIQLLNLPFESFLSRYSSYCHFLGGRFLVSGDDGIKREYSALRINSDGSLAVRTESGEKNIYA